MCPKYIYNKLLYVHITDTKNEDIKTYKYMATLNRNKL